MVDSELCLASSRVETRSEIVGSAFVLSEACLLFPECPGYMVIHSRRFRIIAPRIFPMAEVRAMGL